PGACVQALDFVNEQVGHSQSVMQDEKQKAMAEHMKESAMTSHEPDGQMPGDMNGGASWQGQDGMHCAQVHAVKAGEGLFDIGYDYGVSAQAMVNANPDVSAPNYTIYVGQQICIP
ncbi:MAG: LysM peptidoglycan-binding domain-containing protein, partial [Caldilineaceae bacterium]